MRDFHTSPQRETLSEMICWRTRTQGFISGCSSRTAVRKRREQAGRLRVVSGRLTKDITHVTPPSALPHPSVSDSVPSLRGQSFRLTPSHAVGVADSKSSQRFPVQWRKRRRRSSSQKGVTVSNGWGVQDYILLGNGQKKNLDSWNLL